MVTMGEVETSDCHTGVEHLEDLIFGAARRSDRAEDFGLSPGVIGVGENSFESEIREACVHFGLVEEKISPFFLKRSRNQYQILFIYFIYNSSVTVLVEASFIPATRILCAYAITQYQFNSIINVFLR